MDKDKKEMLKFIGILFLALGIIAVLNNLQRGHAEGILWFCYIGLLAIGLALITINSLLLVSQANILIIPFFIWTIDFLYIWITKEKLLGIANYFFEPGQLFGKVLTTWHLFTIPLIIYAFYLMKLKKKQIKFAWVISMIQIFIIYFFTRFFTREMFNINCVFDFCGSLNIENYYPLAWFTSFFAMILFTNYLIYKFAVK